MAMSHGYKTAFKTQYGLFEYLVMSFGLMNAPAQFQAHMQTIFRELLDVSVVIYIDDILNFSKTLQEQTSVVREVLRQLEHHGLYAKSSKCKFHYSSVEFLGLIISGEGLRMCPDKVETITIVSRFCKFYRRFIYDYSRITVPLTELTWKNVVFQWTSLTQQAFEELRSRFLNAPLLLHPDYSSLRRAIPTKQPAAYYLNRVATDIYICAHTVVRECSRRR